MNSGTSLLRPGEGEHNKLPSQAVDIAPFIPGEGIPWDDVVVFDRLSHFVIGVAAMMDVRLRSGGRWKRLPDPGHLELYV